MRPPLIISSATNPRLKATIALRNPPDRKAAGLFLCEGRRAIGRALSAELVPVDFFHAPEITGQSTETLESWLPQLRLVPPTAGVYELPATLLEKIAYLNEPEGLVAVFRQPRWSLEAVTARASGEPLLVLICVGIEKPGNLGAMIRSVAAAGAHGLLLTGGPIDPFNPNVIRSSTGAIFELPVLSLDDHTLLTWLRAQRVQILAATPEATRSYTDVDMRGPTALLIGAEATGVPYEWLRHAQETGACVGIPMATDTVVDSLNAAVSAAVLLFEAVRQRG